MLAAKVGIITKRILFCTQVQFFEMREKNEAKKTERFVWQRLGMFSGMGVTLLACLLARYFNVLFP